MYFSLLAAKVAVVESSITLCMVATAVNNKQDGQTERHVHILTWLPGRP